ncbi:molybdate ABC transporter substrate-binding protein [Halocynthiibacter sp.]|uniref:molybdate ABC transporter substrate-binding protein n=1 Tax=Halocynthiibacter sp. TaxID=1979210 RepID=UPI003C51E41E
MLYATMLNANLISRFTLSFLMLSSVMASRVAGDEIRVAVASNFLTSAQELSELYEDQTGGDVALINGSSGTLYAQIVNGAPYDLFLSADHARPLALSNAGLSGPPVAYAHGAVVLIRRPHGEQSGANPDLSDVLLNRTAIADPAVAPYGAAALAIYEELNIPEAERNLIYGANVSAAAGLFVSGNVDQAFISNSLARHLTTGEGRLDNIEILDRAIGPVVSQYAVIVSEHPGAQTFLDLIRSEEGTLILARHGYLSIEGVTD